MLVSFEGEVKIIDFGLAKSTQRSQETQANVLLGNFGYMSPEQARGQILDVRTDVYSCGIVLFELVTGTKRFVEENPLKLLEMVARPTPIMPSDRVPSAPKAVDKIYARATSQDKEQRYTSAEAFRDDVTTALHRLNPRASRENLAQFLNHLFLGGQAPPSVDNDVLNKSVVLAARDLHMSSESLGSGNAADDLKNRSLGQNFGEDAPQTASHPLLRSARVGDVLSHDVITGEPPLTTAPAMAASAALSSTPSSPSMKAPLVTAPPPAALPGRSGPAADPQTLLTDPQAQLLEVDDVLPLDEMPLQEALDEGSLEGAPSLGEGDLDSAFENLGLTAQIRNEVRTNEQPSSSQDGAVLSADDDAQQGPTRVYDSPSWPAGGQSGQSAQSDDDAARDEVQRQLEQQAQAEVQRQLEQQAAEAEVQRQLEAQMQAQMQVQMQMQAQLQAQLQAQAADHARQQELTRQAEQQRQAALQAQMAEQARAQATQRQADQLARQQELQQQLMDSQAAQAAPPPQRPEQRAPPTLPQGPTPSRRIQGLNQGTSTETAMPAVNIAPPTPTPTPPEQRAAPTRTPSMAMKKPPSSPPMQADNPPSIVISADLESEVIEANESTTMRNPRASRAPKDDGSGGFNEGGAHESLIIDFGSGEQGSSDEELPVVEGTTPPIRPAARPMGKPVAPVVAAAPAPRPRKASDEGPPSTMPPPTRRR